MSEAHRQIHVSRSRPGNPGSKIRAGNSGWERSACMTISTESMEGGITRVLLDGRLDIQGAQAIDLKMNVLAGSSKLLLIDLTNVSFLGSMGLRSLLLPAQAVKRHGGKTALLNPTPMVEEVLRASNIGE